MSRTSGSTSNSNVTPLRTGIEDRASLAQALTACVGDTFTLMVKTQAYHWNVTGPMFRSVHKLTEEQYEDLFEALDVMAERVRALGYPAPVNAADMVGVSGIEEASELPDATTMVRDLAAGHENAAKRFRQAVTQAEDDNDVVTADLLTERITFHEKAIWMLRALAA